MRLLKVPVRLWMRSDITCGTNDYVELLVAIINGLNAGGSDSFDLSRNEVNLRHEF